MSRQPQPRYLQLAARLRDELRHLKPGDQLPGEVQLAARFSVNRHTLRRAIDELVSEGRVLRQQGRSTRVLARPLIYPLAAGSAYSESLSAQGHGVQARLLQRQLRTATAEEAEHLQLSEGASLLELHVMDPSPIPKFDNPKLNMSPALMLFGAGREKRLYALPPFTDVRSLDFEDHPFAIQAWDQCCAFCGSDSSYLDELIVDDAGTKRFVCSDTDYCTQRRDAQEAAE